MIATGSRPLPDRDSRRARQAHGEEQARQAAAANATAAEVGEGPRRLDVELDPKAKYQAQFYGLVALRRHYERLVFELKQDEEPTSLSELFNAVCSTGPPPPTKPRAPPRAAPHPAGAMRVSTYGGHRRAHGDAKRLLKQLIDEGHRHPCRTPTSSSSAKAPARQPLPRAARPPRRLAAGAPRLRRAARPDRLGHPHRADHLALTPPPRPPRAHRRPNRVGAGQTRAPQHCMRPRSSPQAQTGIVTSCGRW